MTQCLICWDEVDNLHVTSCNHHFCQACINKWLESHDNCPYCRSQLKETVETTITEEVSSFLNTTFPIRSWTIFDHSITLGSLSSFTITVSLRYQRNWVPSSWIDYFAQTYRMDLVHFLNSGVVGTLFLNGVNPPDEVYLCSRCRYVTTEEYVSRHTRHGF